MSGANQFSTVHLLGAVTLAAIAFGLIRVIFSSDEATPWLLPRAVLASLLIGAAIELVTKRPWLAGCGAGVAMAAILLTGVAKE